MKTVILCLTDEEGTLIQKALEWAASEHMEEHSWAKDMDKQHAATMLANATLLTDMRYRIRAQMENPRPEEGQPVPIQIRNTNPAIPA